MSQEKTSQIEFGLKDGKITVLRKEPKMDLTGQRFGKLTVLRKESKSKYRCFCDCGNEITLSQKQLTEDHITSCGCLSSLNLRGNRYGRLVAKEPVDDSSWLCHCDCSSDTVVPTKHLLDGTARSCGCLKTNPIIGQEFGFLTPLSENSSGYKCLCRCGNSLTVSFDDLYWGTITSCGCDTSRSHHEDLTGNTYGEITVVREVSPYIQNGITASSRWLCRCSCGRERVHTYSNLKYHKIRSCGCQNDNNRSLNLEGMTFGDLTVLYPVVSHRSKTYRAYRRWMCKCSCGNLTIVLQDSLIAGKAVNCGCKNPHSLDLTGQRFGKLTVLSEACNYTSPKGYTMRMWNCICDCGKTKTVYQNHLRRGITTSCGCDFTRPHLDLTGKTYHNLTVLHEAEPIITRSGRKHYAWVCQCSCGKTTTVTTKDLTYGHVKSCGCLLKRDLTGQTIGKLTIIKEIEPALTPGGTKDRRWVCKCSCGKTITVRQQALDKGKKSCGCDQLMDLTGQTYGRLTVLREGEKKLKQRTWVCKCSCGSIVTVSQINLRSGSTKSCGCLPHSVPHIDLTGERFGMLTVVREAERKNPKRRRWLCQCDCGRLHEVDHSTLRSGTVKSCGCMQYVRNKPCPEPLVSTRGCKQ